MIKLVIVSFLLLLGNINASVALTQLSKISEKSPYGKLFHEMLELKLEQSKTDEVIDLLAALLKQLKEDERVDSIEYVQKNGQFETDIEVLETSLDISRNQLKDANQQIADINEEYSGLLKSKNTLSKQSEQLNTKEEELRESRNDDDKDYQTRQVNAKRILEGLGKILKKLSELVLGDASLIEKQRVVNEVQNELGKDHPIYAMVQMTTKFDKEKVIEMIKIIEQFKQQVENTLMTANEANEQSQSTFTVMLMQITEVRDRVSQDQREIVSKIKRREQERILAEKQSEELQSLIPKTEQLLELTVQQQKKDKRGEKVNQLINRLQEIEVVEAALQIVKQQGNKEDE